MKKGVCTISIDYEFAWGYADKKLVQSDKDRILKEVEIVKRLISLFEKYNIPVTWGIVGHLLENNCLWDKGLVHPEYHRPIIESEKKDWFFQHPDKDVYDDSLWFDEHGLILNIKSSKVNHEIGSHSYAHIMYDEVLTNEDVIRTDLENMKRVHSVNELSYASFIFPRNIEGFHKQLVKVGVKYYRGNSKKWYDSLGVFAKRFGHLVDQWLPFGRVVMPKVHKSGLINIPDSQLLLGRNGLRKLIKPERTIKKAINGLNKAVKQKKIFHLWFHPSNFSYDTEVQFNIFEEILKNVVEMQKKGDIDIMTLSEIGGSVKTQ